jgi:hypothetical protein
MVSQNPDDLQLDAVGAGDFAEALFGVVQKFGGRDGLGSKRVSPDSTRARVSRSSVRRDMRAEFLRMISRNSRVGAPFSELESSRVSA